MTNYCIYPKHTSRWPDNAPGGFQHADKLNSFSRRKAPGSQGEPSQRLGKHLSASPRYCDSHEPMDAPGWATGSTESKTTTVGLAPAGVASNRGPNPLCLSLHPRFRFLLQQSHDMLRQLTHRTPSQRASGREITDACVSQSNIESRRVRGSLNIVTRHDGQQGSRHAKN